MTDMKNLLLFILMTAALWMLTGCEGKTKMSKELPPNPEIAYVSAGGLVTNYFEIKISGGLMTVSSAPADNPRDVWQAKLTGEDLQKLYKAFVDNQFDLIRPNKEVATDDGNYRSIELKSGDNRYYAVRGDGVELTLENGERFNRVEEAFINLVNKYKK